MDHLYQSVSGGKISFMESPTGTGKTLSILCSSLSWILKQKDQIQSTEPEWVQIHERKRKREANELIQKKRNKRIQINTKDSLLLEDYESCMTRKEELFEIAYGSDDESESVYETPKIIICSRTHSQLAQFTREVRRTYFADKVTMVTLGSRKIMCLNPRVNDGHCSASRMIERCMNARSKNKCSYYDAKGIGLFQDHVLTKIRDIEDAVKLGISIDACPYYGSRKAVSEAQIILVPYSVLLHEKTRQSVGISSLENCVVIVDEAHNLLEAISSTHANQLSLKQLGLCMSQLLAYHGRYGKRLKESNLEWLNKVILIMKSLHEFILSIDKSQIFSINDLLIRSHLEDYNLYDVESFIEKSKLIQKLNGFIEKNGSDDSMAFVESQNGFMAATQFLLTLANVDGAGKLHFDYRSEEPNQSTIRFILLNPMEYFQPIVDQSKSIILASGTLQPFDTMKRLLFSKVAPERLSYFTCGHVINSKKQLFVSTLSSFENSTFNFSFQRRSNQSMILRLGSLVQYVTSCITGGVILFFSSYKYENEVHQCWKKSTLKFCKIFREPSASTKIPQLLKEYKQSIDQGKGAVLSCIIGAKMSEGINFQDQYGRCIIVIGMPFPNKNDLIIQEKMKHLDSLESGAGRKYIHEKMMHGINQSIGRSIRHKDDYSSIILCDERYQQQKKTIEKLPLWIRKELRHYHSDNDFKTNFSQFCTKDK